MDSAGVELADLDRLSVAELKALLQEQHARLAVQDALLHSYTLEIEALKLQILKLRRLQFGSRSEKREREIEQLELWVEELEAAATQRSSLLAQQAGSPPAPSIPKPRREFPAHLARETQTIAPPESSCPDCGGELKHLGEDVCEMLELEPVRFKVILEVRPKLACASCDTIVQAPAPARPIERGMAGPGLLARVVVGKYSDHLPLYRQAEIYAREGVELDRTLLAQWVGNVSALLTPLTDALREHVFAADVVHADDTPIPVLAPGLGKTKTGQLWTYLRDERPAGGDVAPAVWFAIAPIARVHIRRDISKTSPAFCKPTGMRVIPRSTTAAASLKRPAGRIIPSAVLSRDARAQTRPRAVDRGPRHRIRSDQSEGLQEQEQVGLGLPRLRSRRLDARLLPERLHGVALHLQVGRDVAARRGDAGMAEVVADHRDVGPGLQ
jgi:transposase